MPTYNECNCLENILRAILALGLDIKILIVDDNSPDGTGRIADALARSDNHISVLHRPKKEGLGKAYLEGFRRALEDKDVDYIMEMDADFSHDPKYIPKFLEAISDCDIVIGSRFYKGRISIVNWPLSRLILSYGARIYVRLFAGLGLSDPTSGFKCFRRRAVEMILNNGIISNGYAFQIEVNYACKKLGLKFGEIPIIFYNRDIGTSKMGALRTVIDAMAIVWLVKFKRFTGSIK
jgi:dolichol-phosphate mannosyltransferase